jgi:hypothetical protein
MRRPLDWTGNTNALVWTKPEDIKLEFLPYRFPTRSAVTLDAEIRQIEECIKQGYKKLKLRRLSDETLSVVGYGPTLHYTYKEVNPPCITVSGALDFLQDKGIIPDYHAECDGRDYKTKHLERANKKTKYLMASICNPRMWELLKGCYVEYWHNANGQHVVDWISKNDLGSTLIAGGSNIGLSAVHLGGILGYRKFKLFGFDGNFIGDIRHAGPHYAAPQRVIYRLANGRKWKTSPQMSNSCDELGRLFENSEIEIEIIGDSLAHDIIEDTKRACDFWNNLWQLFDNSILDEVKSIMKVAEERRSRASFNTGSINEVSSVILRLLSIKFRPETIFEVGTFIGTSTHSFITKKIFTCDRDNDCVNSNDVIYTNPWKSSTEMLGSLRDNGTKADLMYFDGRLQMADIPLILQTSKRNTIYVLDDYIGSEKGVKNVEMLLPYLKRYRLIHPCGVVRDLTTTAILVPICD